MPTILSLLGTAALCVMSAVLAYHLARFMRVYILINRFHGPLAIPLLGNSYLFSKNSRKRFLQMRAMLEKYRKKSGGLVRFWLGPAPIIVIYNAKHVETILKSNVHITKGLTYKFIEPWLGLGLLTSTGQMWFHRRKLLTPTFHFSILQDFMEVFNCHSSTLVAKLESLAKTSDSINIFPLVANCVLDVICETAMGKKVNAQKDSDNKYVKTIASYSKLLLERMGSPLYWPDCIYLRTEKGKEHLCSLAFLHDVTDKMIQERLAEALENRKRDKSDGVSKQPELTGGKKLAFLDRLLKIHLEEQTLSLEDIREEVDTFMFEGHDTTAAAVSWALLLIGLHSDIQDRIHQELDEVFGSGDQPATTQDLARLSYLTMVIKESLRLMPAVPDIARSLKEEIVLDGKVVPKDTNISLYIYALHQDPEHFPDPGRFDPDRFLPENNATRHPYAFVPFSAGPRNCIGQKFAMLELKVLLSSVLRTFSVHSLQSLEEALPAAELITRPHEGAIYMKISLRE